MMKKITIVLLLLVAAIAGNADNKMKYKKSYGKRVPDPCMVFHSSRQ